MLSNEEAIKLAAEMGIEFNSDGTHTVLNAKGEKVKANTLSIFEDFEKQNMIEDIYEYYNAEDIPRFKIKLNSKDKVSDTGVVELKYLEMANSCKEEPYKFKAEYIIYKEEIGANVA